VAPAEALDLAAEFEIAADDRIVEDAEAIDDGHGAAGHFDHLVGIELQVGLVADGQDHRIGPLEGLFEVGLNPQLREFVLVPEEACPGVARGRVGVLLLQLPLSLKGVRSCFLPCFQSYY
jgi:hypothetical protein